MAGYDNIVGHGQIIEQLQNAIAADKVSHAYILNGPKDSGKMMLAEAFAMALQCEEHDPRGCGHCRSCHQALGHNQPDIIYVQHEKPNMYSVDEIREQLVGDMEIKPYSSRYKVYIIDEAEKIQAAGQNAMLKTIEEPPEYGIILLLTTNADRLLPTILSRCVQLDLRSVPDAVIREYLMKEQGIPDYEAVVSAAFAQGNVGRAVKLAASEAFSEEKKALLALVKRAQSTEIYNMPEKIKELEPYKEGMDDFLDLMQVWYRDVLYYKACASTQGLIFQDQIRDIKAQAEKLSYLSLNKAFHSIEKTRTRLAANGNWDLTMEVLLLELEEL